MEGRLLHGSGLARMRRPMPASPAAFCSRESWVMMGCAPRSAAHASARAADARRLFLRRLRPSRGQTERWTSRQPRARCAQEPPRPSRGPAQQRARPSAPGSPTARSAAGRRLRLPTQVHQLRQRGLQDHLRQRHLQLSPRPALRTHLPRRRMQRQRRLQSGHRLHRQLRRLCLQGHHHLRHGSLLGQLLGKCLRRPHRLQHGHGLLGQLPAAFLLGHHHLWLGLLPGLLHGPFLHPTGQLQRELRLQRDLRVSQLYAKPRLPRQVCSLRPQRQLQVLECVPCTTPC